MKITSIIIAIFLVGAAALFLFWGAKPKAIKSFPDVVRNPALMDDLDEYHNEIDKISSSLSGSAAEIVGLVDSFVFEVKPSSDSWNELRVLAKLGNQTYPRAIEILRDPTFKERLVKLVEDANSLPEAPINRVCDLFDQDTPPPQEALELLAPYLQSESNEIRKSVALVIGSIATQDAIPHLRQALVDKDEYVRSYALMGIQRAIDGQRIGLNLKKVLFETVSGMWPSDTSFNVCNDISEILLNLDRERAIKYLLSDELFSVSFTPVWRILEAFNKETVDVPRERIAAIVNAASMEPIGYPMDNVLEQALPLLAAYRENDDLPLFQRFLEHENENVARGATAALCRFHAINERVRDPWTVVEKQGWTALTVTERRLCAIQELDSEVNNGGFAQYYFNSSGDHWQDALEGLDAIGALQRHRFMMKTIEMFGNVKPSAVRGARNSQLSKIFEKKDDPFDEQDSEWYEVKNERLDKLILKFNLSKLDGDK